MLPGNPPNHFFVSFSRQEFLGFSRLFCVPVVKSVQRMELTLNLVWATLSVVCAGLWMGYARRNGVSTRVQAIALLLFIVILLPVISVTDDLQALQNPAELDCCARRHHAASCPHSIFPAVATLPPPMVAELSFDSLRTGVPDHLFAVAVNNPALASIQNRPPPAA
jgi:hypothetical protein